MFGTAVKRRGNTSKGCDDINLQDKARLWPYMCQIRSTTACRSPLLHRRADDASMPTHTTRAGLKSRPLRTCASLPFRALAGRLKFTGRRHTFHKDSLLYQICDHSRSAWARTRTAQNAKHLCFYVYVGAWLGPNLSGPPHPPLSSKLGTYKAVRTRIRSWLLGEIT